MNAGDTGSAMHPLSVFRLWRCGLWSLVRTTRMTDMHIYPLHDLVMAVTGGICGAAIAIAVMDVKRTIHASDKDRV